MFQATSDVSFPWIYVLIVYLCAVFSAVAILFFRLRFALYILVLSIGVLTLVVLIQTAGPNETAGIRISTFLGSILIVVGWIVTNENTINNSRKQHTISLLTEYMHSGQRLLDKNTIKKRLRTYDTRLTPDMADFADENNELLKAIDRELNFMEFLSVGVFRGDLDDAMVRQCMKTIIIAFVGQCEDYVGFWAAKNASTWQNIRKYSYLLERDKSVSRFNGLFHGLAP